MTATATTTASSKMSTWIVEIIGLAAAAEAEGLYYEDGCCVDCGKDTTPHTIVRDGDVNGFGMEFTRDVTIRFEPETWDFYSVKDRVWAKAGLTETGGCLCVGCLENRLGRRLRPKDFDFERDENLPGAWTSPRLAQRRKDRKGEMVARHLLQLSICARHRGWTRTT
jgi:hypothetical protein